MDRPAAVCFDVGHTLLGRSPGGDRVVAELLAAEGYPADPARMEAALAEARHRYVLEVRSGRAFEASMAAAIEFWTEYFSGVLAHLGVPEKRHAALAARITERAWHADSWQPFPEVLGTLAELRARGVRMAVISNFVDTLGALCESHGLAPFFETIVCSVEVGAMKPDPRIFALTARRLGVDAKDVWYVGDNYWADVLGARAAGMTPVWLDRDGALARPDCLRLRSLDQLPGLLDQALPAIPRPESRSWSAVSRVSGAAATGGSREPGAPEVAA
jgi:2-haloalkanoic acid dehalogenase type II